MSEKSDDAIEGVVDLYTAAPALFEKRNAERARICRVTEDSVGLLDPSEHTGGWTYIPFDECDTHGKILDWLIHLRSKAWFTFDHMDFFFEAVFHKFPGLNPVGCAR